MKIAMAGTGYVGLSSGILLAQHNEVIDNSAKPSDKFDASNPYPPILSTPCRIYNIGNNSPVQLLDLTKTLETAIEKKAEKNYLPMQDGDVVSTYADVSDLINDFGYKPDTSLKVGIERFVEWYREFYGESNDKL